MVEIQQLIVKAKINSGELEDQNIVQTVNSIIENYDNLPNLLTPPSDPAKGHYGDPDIK